MIDTIWRPVYGALVKGLALLTPEWEHLQKLSNFTKLSLRGINWPVELTHGGGIAYSSDGGSTARASNNEPVEATDTWKHMVGRFEVSFDVMDAENDAKFAAQQIEKQVRYQAADKLRSFRRAVSINFYGHNTGIVFLAEGTISNPSGNVTRVKLKDLYGETGLAVPERIRDYFTVGKDYVSIHSGTTSSVRSNGTGKVLAISESGDYIDIDTAAYVSGTTVGDAICLFNQVLSGADDDMDLWFNGLLDITGAQVLHGIDSDDQPDWVAGYEDLSFGAPLEGKALYTIFESIEQRSDYPVEWCYTTIGAIAEAGGAELDQRRYGSDDDTMKLGFKELVSMGVKVESRPYVPAGYAFFGSNKALRKLSPDEKGPNDVIDNGDKSNGFKQYQDRLGFFKDQVFRAQLTAVSRLGLGVLGDVDEAA